MYPTERNQANHQFFFFNATATTEIYTLSLHDALPISGDTKGQGSDIKGPGDEGLPPRTSRPLDLSRPELATPEGGVARSEEHTSELQSHSDLVCRLLLEKKKL